MYEINYDNLKKIKIYLYIIIFILLIVFICLEYFYWFVYIKHKNYEPNYFAIVGLPIILFLIPIIKLIQLNKKINNIYYLNKNGKLVKCIPCEMAETGIEILNTRILRPIVEYVIAGEKRILKGEARFDRYKPADDTVDLLIDEQNPNIYFIDMEINRKGGNKPEDYYIKM